MLIFVLCVLLAAGVPRWDQKVFGYEYTILNGVVTFENGTHTGAVPGALVRGKGSSHVKTGELPDAPEWASNSTRISSWDIDGGAAGSIEGSTADTALQASLDSEAGISNQSRIAEALEKEEQKAAAAAATASAAKL